MHYLRTLGVFARLGLLNDMQYRVNFLNQLAVSILGLALSLAAVLLVFRHTDSIGVWTRDQLVMLLGVHIIVRGFIGLFLRPSMGEFLEGVRTGDFDFVLLKPLDSQVMVCIQRFRLWSLVDMLLGGGLIVWVIVAGTQEIDLVSGLLFGITLLSGFVIVIAFWMTLAITCFWIIRIDNIFVVFDSLFQTAKWPVTIYPDLLRILLTFVIPVAWAVTMPAATLSGHMDNATILWSLLIPFGFCVVARLSWVWGLKHYAGASA